MKILYNLLLILFLYILNLFISKNKIWKKLIIKHAIKRTEISVFYRIYILYKKTQLVDKKIKKNIISFLINSKLDFEIAYLTTFVLFLKFIDRIKNKN